MLKTRFVSPIPPDMFSRSVISQITPRNRACTPIDRSKRAKFRALRAGLIAAACTTLLFALTACSPGEDDTQSSLAKPPSTARAETTASPKVLDAMLISEELIEGFRAEMTALAFAVQNLELPDDRTRRLFRTLDLQVTDLAQKPDAPNSDPTLQALQLSSQNWPIAEATTATNSNLGLWKPLFDKIDRFSWTNFKIKSGHFVKSTADEPDEFEMRVAFSGLARLANNHLSWVRTIQTLRWRMRAGNDPTKTESWRIVSWQTQSANHLDSPSPLFEDVIDSALPDFAQRETARRSLHERFTADHLLAQREGKKFEWPHERFFYQKANGHPGLSVVDLDQDGFDDLYIVARWGRNQFFHNRGDGTFEEKAAEYGLDAKDFSSSAVFADFDNDGDLDLFLGRTLERSRYFENQNGHFVDQSSTVIDRPLPYLASSISAVDYDGDGLLDIYVSTYNGTGASIEQYYEYLSLEDATAFDRLALNTRHAFLNSVGPPNVLLHNEGNGRFSVVEDAGDLRAFRHTYQATWADFDQDGDPDVYLANDFAPDAVIRNEGNGRFVEVTKEIGFTAFGLGMGVSWGDYDRDGNQDAYVSNMYSTAGSRITDQLGYVDDRYRQMAQGNYLYRNEGDQFRKVSGPKPPDFAVEKTGWSWGSQFVDVDNDGFLDLGVLNGFYTAPREVAIAGDT